LPSAACVGYTLIFTQQRTNTQGTEIWKHLISDENIKGPIHVGALEYEDLRIEAGQAAFGKEITKATKASPLELHWQKDTINTQKGCYLGQEGVASMLKNIRGPPRILYSVVFDDDDNVYETQSRGDGSQIENLTRPPKIGDVLHVLGSNGEISVGTLTSVAQPGGTGEPCTVGLVLVRRADSIRKQMKGMDLEIHRDEPQVGDIVEEASGIIQPPPLDPLDGLEVIIAGSFTMGKLRMVPSRRWRRGKSMLDSTLKVEGLVDEDDRSRSASTTTTAPQVVPSEEDELQRAVDDAVKAQAEADAAAAEAKRKADKMEMLKKRAEEAMARKKAAKEKKE
jgi:folate-binding protein YgfZ